MRLSSDEKVTNERMGACGIEKGLSPSLLVAVTDVEGDALEQAPLPSDKFQRISRRRSKLNFFSVAVSGSRIGHGSLIMTRGTVETPN
jgi:hypothetical protein